MLSDEYIAGFMDGEGTFYFSHAKHNTKSGKIHLSPTVHVSVSNTYLPILEMMHEKYGGYLREKKNNGLGIKKIYQLQFRYGEMGLFLPNILPYLVEKRERAQTVLDFLEGRNV